MSSPHHKEPNSPHWVILPPQLALGLLQLHGAKLIRPFIAIIKKKKLNRYFFFLKSLLLGKVTTVPASLREGAFLEYSWSWCLCPSFSPTYSPPMLNCPSGRQIWKSYLFLQTQQEALPAVLIFSRILALYRKGKSKNKANDCVNA